MKQIWHRAQGYHKTSLLSAPFFILSLLITTFVLSHSLSIAQSGNPATSLANKTSKLVQNGGFIVTKKGAVTAKLNPDRQFIPASILKIATSAASLHILGKNYRFATSFYQNENGDFYIKGNGDPVLTSEEIRLISQQLIKHGLEPFKKIIIDNSAYQLEKQIKINGKSRNPYDATISALTVNFNTLNLLVQADGQIHSAEDQTPDLPIMQTFGKDLPQGKHRISINSNPTATAEYAGQLITALLQKAFHQNNQAGIEPSKIVISEGNIPSELRPFYVHTSSKELTEIIKALLLYSNNLIANHLFLSCGAAQFGYPATWEKGQKTIRQFLEVKIGLASDSFKIVEGSGLSRANKITPGAMIKILDFFIPNRNLLARHKGTKLKSGTLTGVFSYAGYLPNFDPFVLILNQKSNTRDALIRLLTKYHNVSQQPEQHILP